MAATIYKGGSISLLSDIVQKFDFLFGWFHIQSMWFI